MKQPKKQPKRHRKAKNITLDPLVRAAGERIAQEDGKKFSELVSDLIRDLAKARGKWPG